MLAVKNSFLRKPLSDEKLINLVLTKKILQDNMSWHPLLGGKRPSVVPWNKCVVLIPHSALPPPPALQQKLSWLISYLSNNHVLLWQSLSPSVELRLVCHISCLKYLMCGVMASLSIGGPVVSCIINDHWSSSALTCVTSTLFISELSFHNHSRSRTHRHTQFKYVSR